MSSSEGSLFGESLRGTVARVVYENADNRWAVLRLDTEEGLRVSAVGTLAPVFEGDALELRGEWEWDKRYGRQFRASSSRAAEPLGEVGVRRYLSSGRIPGIGAELARRLVDAFGGDTLRILDEEPARLLTVRGIGPKRLADIEEAWQEHAADRRARIGLHDLGLGNALTERVLDAWGGEALTKVRANPYGLIADVRGVGFRIADSLALGLGWHTTSAPRLRAGLRHVLQEATNEGHCYLPLSQLSDRASRLLGLTGIEVPPFDTDDPAGGPASASGLLGQSIDRMAGTGEIVVERARSRGSRAGSRGAGGAELDFGADEGSVTDLRDSRAQGGESVQNEAELSEEFSAAAEEPPAWFDDIPASEEDQRRVFLSHLYGAEQRIARRLALLASAAAQSSTAEASLDGILRHVESKLRARGQIELGSQQRRAVERTLNERLLVVTGGPGTGKTTIVNTIVQAFQLLEQRPTLAAPTGRAAKRLEEATGQPAKTLHRLLEFQFDTGFGRGPERPLEADLVIVDEASMIDLTLMDALVGALPLGCGLLLVGDSDQLPSVGPGAVLRDLIGSGAVPTVRLTEIYRQAKRSLIVRNAHRINTGQMPVREVTALDEELSGADDLIEVGLDTGVGLTTPGGPPTPDFYYIEERDSDRSRELAVRLVRERMPKRFGLDPVRDIQVMAPMHRGRCGVERLNVELQAALNVRSGALIESPTLSGISGISAVAGSTGTSGDSVAAPRRATLCIGDRVMQLRNDYDREVFNGDIGWVVAVDDELGVSVDFAGRIVGYDRKELGDLTLAYAITIHKSQGSEYDAVVALLLPEHHIMLQRNLLYTALTRGRNLVVLISTDGALRRAIGNNAPSARYSALAERLSAAFGGVFEGAS